MTSLSASRRQLPPSAATTSSSATACTSSYESVVVAEDLDVRIPRGSLTMIIGPNGCGKSTLLKALARMLRPERGTVLLDGSDIHSAPTKAVARRLGLLPQSPVAPDGISVADLVSRGRYPYQKLLRQWSRDDELIVNEAMAATGVSRVRPAQRRRALGRRAAAGLAGDGAGAADRHPAARRAHDVPRPRAPDRRPRALRDGPGDPGHDGRRRDARAQPGDPVRRPPDRHAGRAGPGRRQSAGHRDRGADRADLRPAVPDRDRPRDRQADGRAPRARRPGRRDHPGGRRRRRAR